jgi:hypothetical protein
MTGKGKGPILSTRQPEFKAIALSESQERTPLSGRSQARTTANPRGFRPARYSEVAPESGHSVPTQGELDPIRCRIKGRVLADSAFFFNFLPIPDP